MQRRNMICKQLKEAKREAAQHDYTTVGVNSNYKKVICSQSNTRRRRDDKEACDEGLLGMDEHIFNWNCATEMERLFWDATIEAFLDEYDDELKFGDELNFSGEPERDEEPKYHHETVWREDNWNDYENPF